MTREEAIAILHGDNLNRCSEKENEALEMAIQALSQEPCDVVSRGVFEQVMWERDIAIEQLHELGYEWGQKIEPCEDAVNRQAVDDMIKAEMPERGMWEIEGDKEKETVCEVCVDLMQKLSELPPVNPQEQTGHCKDCKWIPVSERLPEEDGQYLITVKYKHVNDSYEDVYAEHGEWYDGRWDMFCFGHCGEVEDIIAWMPLPKPYEPQERSDKE